MRAHILAVAYSSLHCFSKEVYERLSHSMRRAIIFTRDSISRVCHYQEPFTANQLKPQRRCSQNESYATGVTALKFLKTIISKKNPGVSVEHSSPHYLL